MTAGFNYPITSRLTLTMCHETARCKNKSSDAHPARAWPVTRELKTASVMGKSLLFMKPNMVLKKQRRKLKTFFFKKVNSKGIIFYFFLL